MHEISVLYEAVKAAEKVALDNKAERIKFMTLEVGELTGYLPIFFEKYFPVITEDRPLFRDSELRIETVSGEALCSDCQSLYNVMKCEGICPQCKSRRKQILGGRDFLVKEIGV